VALLPYIEQDALYRLITAQLKPDPKSPAFDGSPTSPGRHWASANPEFSLAWTKIKNLNCPSDEVLASSDVSSGAISIICPPADNRPVSAGGNHNSTGAFLFTSNTTDVGKTNYAGVAGANGDTSPEPSTSDGPGINLAQYRGIFYNRS